MAKRHYYKVLRFEHFRSFCEVARLGSFEAAGRAVGLSRTTIWQQIDALERVVEVALFERRRRGVALTDAGRQLLEVVHPPLTALESAVDLIRGQVAEKVPRLRVATIPGAEMRAVVTAYQRRNPAARLTVVELPGNEVVRRLESGTCDIGFCLYGYTLPNNPVVHFEPVGNRDVVLITPAQHPLAHKPRLTLRDLAEEPLICVTPANVFRDHVDRCFDRAELLPRLNVVVESDRLESHEEYVKLGAGVAIAWPTPGRRPPRGLHYRSLNRLFGSAPQYLLWKKGLNLLPHASQFVNLAKEMLSGGAGGPVKD